MTSPSDVEHRIADTALQLLRTGGPRSVTVQAVQSRSGIAKTTIYRRHRDRREMLRAALSELMTPRRRHRGPRPPTGCTG
jgi:AcrR family transcriptional regulator